ncbi:MAG: hypothetical protein LBQ69_03555, partial [Treponema sp.]|nr:hypothetical protein [Treponema sp.]
MKREGDLSWRSCGLRISELLARVLAFFGIRDDNFKYRVAALVMAAVLAIFAFALGFSLLGAVFGISAFSPVLGMFFSHSYGILAFFIPLYLGYAAFTLADPRWRPERVYLLIVSLFPFLTLAAGFIVIRDFEALSLEHALLDSAGKTVFGLAIVVLTFLEVVALQILKGFLFARKGGGGEGGIRRGKGPALLPPPKADLKEVYAESVATGEWIDGNRFAAGFQAAGPETAGDYQPGEAASPPIDLDLPAARPLNTPLALEYLGESQRHHAKAGAGSVERALEEAEMVAQFHSEQARKRSSGGSPPRPPKRKYHVPL